MRNHKSLISKDSFRRKNPRKGKSWYKPNNYCRKFRSIRKLLQILSVPCLLHNNKDKQFFRMVYFRLIHRIYTYIRYVFPLQEDVIRLQWIREQYKFSLELFSITNGRDYRPSGKL